MIDLDTCMHARPHVMSLLPSDIQYIRRVLHLHLQPHSLAALILDDPPICPTNRSWPATSYTSRKYPPRFLHRGKAWMDARKKQTNRSHLPDSSLLFSPSMDRAVSYAPQVAILQPPFEDSLKVAYRLD